MISLIDTLYTCLSLKPSLMKIVILIVPTQQTATCEDLEKKKESAGKKNKER